MSGDLGMVLVGLAFAALCSWLVMEDNSND
jgi:hypothetical protein